MLIVCRALFLLGDNGIIHSQHKTHMTTMKSNSNTNQPWKKLIFSAVMAGSLAVLPVSRATLPNTTSANLTTVYATGGAV